LLPHAQAVGLVAELADRQQDADLELAEPVTLRHVLCSTNEN